MSRTNTRYAGELTIQAATGAISSAVVTAGNDTLSVSQATIVLDITEITLPATSHELDFYLQTKYDSATSTWVDCQNFHFTTADDGGTSKIVAFVDDSLDGPGTLKSITGTNPAAGTEISETVPANAVWKPLSISYSLVTATTAADRFPQPVLDDGTNVYYAPPSFGAHAANLTKTYNIADVEINASTSTVNVNIPLPAGIVLQSGHRFKTNTSGIQAEDNYSAPQLYVEEWHQPSVYTDGTIRDNVKSYGRPLGSKIRLKTALTGTSTTISYAFSAQMLVVQ